jgi:hypothetical protein
MKNILTSKNVTKLVDYNSDDGSIVIPEGITVIGAGAFKLGTAIKSVSIPNSVTVIGVGAFYRCKLLTSVTIPDSVTEIGSYAFYGCISLQKLQLSNSLKTIGTKAFKGCTWLTSVTIPDSVVRIYDHVFEKCTALESVTINNKDTMIDYCAFLKCNALQLTDQIERSDIVRCRCCKEDINTRKDACYRIIPYNTRDQYMCLDCGRRHSKNPNKYCLVCEGNHCYSCMVKHRDGTSFPRDEVLETEWLNT